jgi:hypothetical protein
MTDTPESQQPSPDAAVPHLYRCVGRLMTAWFTSERDLRPLVPAAFELPDRHRAFLKAYELKFGVVGRPYLRPAFSQYRQICVAVLAAPRGHQPMHVNLFMWEERGWSLQGGGNGASWNKKFADIEISRLFPLEEQRVDPADPPAYDIDVSTYGSPLMRFDGLLDGRPRIEPPPLNGFYFGGAPGDPVHALKLREPFLGAPWHGTGTLEFWASPHEVPLRPGDWSAASLGAVRVEGCCLQDVMFLRDYRDVTRL